MTPVADVNPVALAVSLLLLSGSSGWAQAPQTSAAAVQAMHLLQSAQISPSLKMASALRPQDAADKLVAAYAPWPVEPQAQLLIEEDCPALRISQNLQSFDAPQAAAPSGLPSNLAPSVPQEPSAPVLASSNTTRQHRNGPTEAPLSYSSFASRIESDVDEVRLQAERSSFAADGISTIRFVATVLDADGKPVMDEQEITLEASSGAKLLVPGRKVLADSAEKGDANALTPATQIKLRDGKVAFEVVAPMQPGDVLVRANVKGRVVELQVSALPDERNMFVVGLVELQVRDSRMDWTSITPANENDGFDRELQRWSAETGNGNGRVDGRTALYLKGMISGSTLLTLSYDSKKSNRDILFQDINPNAMYPVYGDSSVRGVDAQSASKLYVRLDRGRSWVMYGDYTTQSQSTTLASYSRSLTGVKGHWEEGAIKGNAWVAYDRSRQVVDEFVARGVSGPYSVSNPNGKQGSEIVELIVRDRFQPGTIIKTTVLQRFSDYSFEPFNGRIVFAAPVPSVDSNGNPVTIRVTYEVDDGGARFAVAGADVQLNLTPDTAIGASVARDSNPASPYTVVGLSGQTKLPGDIRLKAEVAHSQGVAAVGYNPTANPQTADSGAAVRVEAAYEADDLRVLAVAAKAQAGFHGASSPVSSGRTELSLQAAKKLTAQWQVSADARSSKDDVNDRKSDGVQLAADYAFSKAFSVGFGLRHTKQNEASLTTAGTLCNAAGGLSGFNTGFGITPNGGQAVNPATGQSLLCNQLGVSQSPAMVTNSGLFARARYQLTEKVGLFGEAGYNRFSVDAPSSTGSAVNYAVGVDYKPYDLTRVYLRHERAQSAYGLFGTGAAGSANLTTLGVDTEYMRDGHIFSEYRLRDAASGRDVQNAIGLRNGFMVAQGLRLVTNVELLRTATPNPAAGTPASSLSKALGLGLEYTANPLYKASGRVEWRQDNTATNYLTTAGIAAKIDRDWTIAAREYSNQVNPNTGGKLEQIRVQTGLAYRPVDNNRFDALAMVEWRKERNQTADGNTYGTSGLNRDVRIFSLHANYHPVRPLWVSGRLAYKQNVGDYPTATGTVSDTFNASLIGLRVKYDISNRWTVGVNANALQGQGRRDYAWGPEAGYIVRDNLMLVAGYTFKGFVDKDLAADQFTQRGWYFGLRWKFDETLFGSDKPAVNKTLAPQ